MKKKLVSILLCVVMVVAMFTGCDQAGSGEGDSGSSGEGSKKVGISMPTKSLERWNRDGSYLKQQFEKEGYEVKITYSDNDAEQQVNDIQNLVSDGVNILIVAAIDGESLTTVLNGAKSNNIPVISYDRLIRNTDAVSYYVSFDNYIVGTLQGQYIIDTLDLDNAGQKTYNMEITAGDPADNNASFFYNGAMDTLKEYIDAGTIKIPSGQKEFEKVATERWDTSTALNRMQNLLASYYANGIQLDIALCSNDSTALGVTQAISQDYKGDNTPLITGQDGDEENLKNILDGKQSMTVYKAVANEAVVTLALAKEILSGNKPAKDFTTNDAFKNIKGGVIYDTYSYDNGTGKIPSFLLKPEIVTKDNYKELLVDTGYYSKGEDGYLKAVQ